MANTVVGLYSSTSVAREVIDDLTDNGFDRSDIDLEESARSGLSNELTRGGVPSDDAEYYEEGVRDGGSLVVLRAPEAKTNQAVDIMERHSTRDAEFLASTDTDVDRAVDRDVDTTARADTGRTSGPTATRPSTWSRSGCAWASASSSAAACAFARSSPRPPSKKT